MRVQERVPGSSATRLRGVWAAFTELGGVVLPVECPGCGARGVALCPACAGRLTGAPQQVALSCGPLPGEVGAWAVSPYAGEIRRLVVAWKDRGRHDVTDPLAGALAGAVLALLASCCSCQERWVGRSAPRAGPSSGVVRGWPRCSVVLVPVPSSRRARAERGADVVHQLALFAARRVRAAGIRVRVLPALRLGRTVADQAGLNRSARANNVAGAMCLRGGAGRAVRGSCCVIVDDVLTTGATVQEAARVLTAAGGRLAGVAASCATPLDSGLLVTAHLH